VSNALEKWKDERAEALDSLDAIHGNVTGRRRGRKYNTKHLNRTLFVALSAEFQGFCRDLHEDAAIHIAESIETVPGNARVVPVVLDALVQERTVAQKKPTKGRRLDKGNADLDALSTDFSVLGVDLWNAMSKHYPGKTPKWRKTLDSLNAHRHKRHRVAISHCITCSRFGIIPVGAEHPVERADAYEVLAPRKPSCNSTPTGTKEAC
jgi:hypothetical protein